jgi:hypothetical protein
VTGGDGVVAIRMRVIRVPRVLGRVLAGIAGIFGWKVSQSR